MSKFETNKVDVRGDGKVILYQRADVTSSPKWNCRISVTGSTGYKRFSTKTSDQKNAERIALDKYFELRQKVESDPKNPKYLQTIRGSGYVLWID